MRVPVYGSDVSPDPVLTEVCEYCGGDLEWAYDERPYGIELHADYMILVCCTCGEEWEEVL